MPIENRQQSFAVKINNSTINVYVGNILESAAEVIVSSDNTHISMGGGLSGLIHYAGGSSILVDAHKKLPANVGDVVVSTAGALRQKFIFHCMSMTYEEACTSYRHNDENLRRYIIQHSVERCFTLLHALELTSIAFPCIGAGSAGFKHEQVIQLIATTFVECLRKTQKQLNIELYLHDRFNQKSGDDFANLARLFQSTVAHALRDGVMDNDALHQGQPLFDMAMDHKVFISYSRKDTLESQYIKRVLDDNNVKYWFDKERIYNGVNYKAAIVEALDHADVVLFLSSVNANASRNVLIEVEYAIREGKYVIPIHLDDSPYASTIRLDLQNINYVTIQDVRHNPSALVTSISYGINRKNRGGE
ncbi:MAG: TIR domain-containing protein [Alistipes sp.]|nr:TIR domain-containing protein [Alistipes sp.]